MRCDPDTNEPRRFSTFCPKAIALKGKKMPDTMLSRTVFIEMKRRLRSEKVDHFRHLDDAGFARMRSQLARWAQDSGEALGLAQPAQPEGFMNRTASNWQLMFAIADSLGHGERARAAAQYIAGATDMTSAGVALLRDIRAMFDASTLDYLTSKTIIERLTEDPEKPWAEWSRGRPISEKGVAHLLHEYCIVSRTVGPRGAEAKGYRKADFKDAWERYLAEAEKAGEPAGVPAQPSKRRSPSGDYILAENSAVEGVTFDGRKTGGTLMKSTPSTFRRERKPPGAPSPGFPAPMMTSTSPSTCWWPTGRYPSIADPRSGRKAIAWTTSDNRTLR
jgi:hypothetical protein